MSWFDIPVQREPTDDGCQPGNHRRDELCSRTPVKSLPPVEVAEIEDERGGST